MIRSWRIQQIRLFSQSIFLLPFNINETLFSSQLNYKFSDQESVLESWEAALSRDIAQSMRLTAGTARIDPAGFQTSDAVFGIGIEKKEGIGGVPVLADRYRTSFEVFTDSTAEIYLNRRLIKSIRLTPGSYELSDFPMATGLNEVSYCNYRHVR
jgi:hypothetical protein